LFSMFLLSFLRRSSLSLWLILIHSYAPWFLWAAGGGDISKQAEIRG